MSCVLGHANSDVARLLEYVQQICGMSDSVFLRGVVYAFLIDKGYAAGEKDENGLGTKTIQVSPAQLKRLAQKCHAILRKHTL